MESQSKRTYYKKWWFWIIGIIFIIASIISPPKSTVSSITATAGIITAPATLVSGTYKIGTDIKAGEYVLIFDEEAKVQTIEFQGIFNNINFEASGIKRIIVPLIEGQYLKLEAKSCKIYPMADAPKVEMNEGKLYPGMYKVGVDVPAGKYKVYNYTYATITINKENALRKNQILSHVFSGATEYTFWVGDIISISNQYVILTPSTGMASTATPVGNSSKEDYTGGKDLNVGEYILISNDVVNEGYLYSYSKGDYYTGSRYYFTLSFGEEVSIYRCKIYSADNAPKAELMDGKLPEGMYKIGTDLPAGSYQIVSKAGANAYYEIAPDSTHLTCYESRDFKGSKTITVKNGQYLKVENGYIMTN